MGSVRHLPRLLALVLPLGACSVRDFSLGSRCPGEASTCRADVVDASSDAASEAQVVLPPADAAGEPPCEGSCLPNDAGTVKGYKRCVPGQYVGDFYVPEYKPVAAGLCGLATLYGGEGAGSWQFAIPEMPAEPSEVIEIATCLELEIPRAPDDPVDGELLTSMTATLNCETGELSGEFHGAYYSVGVCDLGTTEAWYSVKGFVNASFDAETMTFEAGQLDIHEPASLLPFADQLSTPPGGSGTWQASWRPLEETSFPSEGCLDGVEYTDFEVQR